MSKEYCEKCKDVVDLPYISSPGTGGFLEYTSCCHHCNTELVREGTSLIPRKCPLCGIVYSDPPKMVLYTGIFGDLVRNQRMSWEEAQAQIWAEAKALGNPGYLCMVLDGSGYPCGVAVLSKPAIPDDQEEWLVEAVYPKTGRKEKFQCLG